MEVLLHYVRYSPGDFLVSGSVTSCFIDIQLMWFFKQQHLKNHIKRFTFRALSAPPPCAACDFYFRDPQVAVLLLLLLHLQYLNGILRSRYFFSYFYSASKGSSGRVTRRRLTSATQIQSFTHCKDKLEMQQMWIFFNTDQPFKGSRGRRTEMRKQTQTDDQFDQNKNMAIIICSDGCFFKNVGLCIVSFSSH